MAKVKELVAEATKNNSTRKTVNNELYYNLIVALCTDDEYTMKKISKISGDEIITEDHKLSDEFRKIIVSALKKCGTMSEAEAIEAAKEFKPTIEQAKTITNIVREADYVAMKECGKKVKMFDKPGFDVATLIAPKKETIKSNPKDPSKKVKIKSHDVLKVEKRIHAFQKECL